MCVYICSVCDKKLGKRRNKIKRENLGVLEKKSFVKEKMARIVQLNKK